MTLKILVIDDEISIGKFLKLALEANNYQVAIAHSGAEGLQKVVSINPDLVILDFGLPDMQGIEVLHEIRSWSQVPIIFLTVRDGDDDKVQALDGGADDYLTKPFSIPELNARIRVALRHSKTDDENAIITIQNLKIDLTSHQIFLSDREVKLTATEYSLVTLLAKHHGKMVSHRMILKEVWGPNSVEHYHYLRVYFGQIRKKFEAIEKGSSKLIENESGIGYRIN